MVTENGRKRPLSMDAIHMRVNILTTRSTDMVSSNGKVATDMWGFTSMMKGRA